MKKEFTSEEAKQIGDDTLVYSAEWLAGPNEFRIYIGGDIVEEPDPGYPIRTITQLESQIDDNTKWQPVG